MQDAIKIKIIYLFKYMNNTMSRKKIIYSDKNKNRIYRK